MKTKAIGYIVTGSMWATYMLRDGQLYAADKATVFKTRRAALRAIERTRDAEREARKRLPSIDWETGKMRVQGLEAFDRKMLVEDA